jgi:hypothetical protein
LVFPVVFLLLSFFFFIFIFIIDCMCVGYTYLSTNGRYLRETLRFQILLFYLFIFLFLCHRYETLSFGHCIQIYTSKTVFNSCTLRTLLRLSSIINYRRICRNNVIPAYHYYSARLVIIEINYLNRNRLGIHRLHYNRFTKKLFLCYENV